jgi:hypothetical protein
VATDAPIGRVGYVMDGFGVGSSNGAGTEVRCNSCREWFATAPKCPSCGHPRPGFNKSIRTAQLNNNLFQQIERAELQKVRGRA